MVYLSFFSIILCKSVTTWAVSPQVLNRRLTISVSAPTWSTQSHSAICETFAYFSSKTEESTRGSESDKDSNQNDDDAPYSILSEILRRMMTIELNKNGTALTSFDDGVKLAIEAVRYIYPNESSIHETLLPLELSLRSHAPFCEMHRSLSRQALSSMAVASSKNEAVIPTTGLYAFVVWKLPRNVVYATSISELKELLQTTPAQDKENDDRSRSTHDDLQPWAQTLPNESVYHPSSSHNGSVAGKLPVALLYGQADSVLFVSFYQYLAQAGISFVVRFMGHTHYGEIEPSSTYLQGYGARLDIRNVEYTAFDNTHVNDTDKISKELPINDEDSTVHSVMDQLSPLLNLQHFILQHSNLNQTDFVVDYDQLTLYRLFITQSQKIPPKAQWKDLGLQAATVIATWTYPQDPLWTLQEIVQNLPSHASSLVQLTVPRKLRRSAIRVNELLGITSSRSVLRQLLHSKSNTDGFFELYINGRKVSMQSPTLNIFHVLHVLRQEDQLLTDMHKSLGPYLTPNNLGNDETSTPSIRNPVFEKLCKWMAMGKEEFERKVSQKDVSEKETEDVFDMEYQENSVAPYTPVRIDVGHGYRGAVIYLNDIEKDAVYENWPRQVSQFVMAMQFQSAPRIRRNMLTVLLVIDPTTTDISEASDISATIQMLLNMAQSGYPLRMGLLLVHDDDVSNCKKELQNDSDHSTCNVRGPFNYDDSSIEILSDPDEASSTHTAFLMVLHALKSYDGFFALQYLGKMIEDLSNALENDESITLNHLIGFHISIMSMIDVSPEDARLEIMSLLSSKGDDLSGDITYGNAINFAARKNVESGFAFINGRPVPLSDPRDLQAVLIEELEFITDLIRLGRITDSKPRSVYGHLLGGKRVYPKMHRLLAESTKGIYEVIQHDYDHLSILTIVKDPSKTVTDLDTVYLLEVVFDLDSEYGINFAISCLNAFERLRENIALEKEYDDTAIALRFIPSTNGSEALDTVSIIINCAGVLQVEEFYTFLRLMKDTVENSNTQESNDKIMKMLAKIRNNDNCVKKANKQKFSGRSNYISLNGRYYAPSEVDGLYTDDLEILLDLEKELSRKITQELKMLVQKDRIFDTIGRITAYFGKHFSSDKAQRKDIESILARARLDSSIEPLLYSWNQEKEKIHIVCFLDPLTEAAQRATPFLKIVRDSLQLPLTVVLVPPLEIHENSQLPITSYYRFAMSPNSFLSTNPTNASFDFLPTNHVLTLRMDVPESWDVQQIKSIQDTDNLRCDAQGCGDAAFSVSDGSFDIYNTMTQDLSKDSSHVEYGLESLLFFGQCWDISVRSPPNGLQLGLSSMSLTDDKSYPHYKETVSSGEFQILPDGSLVSNAVIANMESAGKSLYHPHSDTLVMKTLGYWQLRANPGIWKLEIASHSRGADIFEIVDGAIDSDGAIMIKSSSDIIPSAYRTLVMKDYISKYQSLLVRRKTGFEDAELFDAIGDGRKVSDEDTVHVFSLATGHLYERFLKIMMLSVTKRTSTRVKFWLFENFLSPGFKTSATYMADRIGCQIEFVTYKWPEWLRGQSEKQRIIWGYKILFLDVLFPLNLKKIIYVDADQVVRSDLKELWDLDLEGAPYGYTPFCDSRESTLGYQFWRKGFWKDHLQGKPYHISALYVIDLERFRRELVGDHLRAVYQQLSADPSSLSNLDQDLPNYVQDVIKIHSLPQEWLWCESWCSDETKASAKTIDLCNNPEHKEPKLSMAKRIISGPLFSESWIELDEEVKSYDNDYIITQKARRE